MQEITIWSLGSRATCGQQSRKLFSILNFNEAPDPRQLATISMSKPKSTRMFSIVIQRSLGKWCRLTGEKATNIHKIEFLCFFSYFMDEFLTAILNKAKGKLASAALTGLKHGTHSQLIIKMQYRVRRESASSLRSFRRFSQLFDLLGAFRLFRPFSLNVEGVCKRRKVESSMM